MIIFRQAADLKKHAQKVGHPWKDSGFVPTMGALHDGHMSLIKTARANSRVTIASIFVNPSQFNDPEDFKKYPKTIASDIRMLEEAGCEVLFLPDVTEMYPEGWQHSEPYNLGSLETLLEGFYRPGHFQGVCQAVQRLLEIVEPGNIFMGQKDFQQCMVVQRLIALKNLPVQLHTCPTLREADGLAMSSRNVRLSVDERSIAPAIFREMQLIKKDLDNMPLRTLEARAIKNLVESGFSSVDYVSIATPATLQPLDEWEEGLPTVILVAAYIGGVRLIDNITI
jgi:pantoate--beta-alanine ligase